MVCFTVVSEARRPGTRVACGGDATSDGGTLDGGGGRGWRAGIEVAGGDFSREVDE